MKQFVLFIIMSSSSRGDWQIVGKETPFICVEQRKESKKRGYRWKQKTHANRDRA